MRDTHTEDVHVFREVMGVEQDLIKHIVADLDKAYIVDVMDRTTNYINTPVSDLLNYVQVTYGQLIPHRLLKQEDVANSTTYYRCGIIVIIYDVVEKLLEFSELPGTPISQAKSIKIAYVIIHKTEQFSLAICEWNRKTQNLKPWINFNSYFCTYHTKLRSKTALTDQYSGVKHSNMVRDIVTGLQNVIVGHVSNETSTPV